MISQTSGLELLLNRIADISDRISYLPPIGSVSVFPQDSAKMGEVIETEGHLLVLEFN